jgi:hypothetical protein
MRGGLRKNLYVEKAITLGYSAVQRYSIAVQFWTGMFLFRSFAVCSLLKLITAHASLRAHGSFENPPVLVEVYYEALCPSCQDFIKGPLHEVLEMPDMVAISDLKLVPYVR